MIDGVISHRLTDSIHFDHINIYRIDTIRKIIFTNSRCILAVVKNHNGIFKSFFRCIDVAYVGCSIV